MLTTVAGLADAQGGTQTGRWLHERMPEGHTLHRLALDHHKWLSGLRIRSTSPQGRFADEAAELDRQRLDAIEAFGKHLFSRFESGAQVHVHLGLYGRFRRWKQPALPVP